jgi:DNA-binding NtrC family response regulator
MNSRNILIVDDEEDVLRGLDKVLKAKGYSSSTASSGTTAVENLKGKNYSLIISDLMMPGMSGLDLLEVVKRDYPHILFIVLTGYGTVESAIKAMKMGVYDYLSKPVNIEELLILIDKAFRYLEVMEENRELREKLDSRYSFNNIIGKNHKMRDVFDLITDVSPTNATVLVAGESGTGKELVASAIHYNSQRKDGPFVKVNCAALPENLLESELFGHVKGAFTGALRDSRGRFELAHRGTIFLDEVGDLAPHLQQKLLRVLQEKEFEPVGSAETRKADVRVIAASNRDLKTRINDGGFREDLYYRLAVITIKLPPLREKRDDIVPLLRHFLDKYNGETGKDIKDISPHALDILFSYSWPGNVRELENVIERAVILSKTDTIEEDTLPEEIRVKEVGYPLLSEEKSLPEMMRWRKNSSSTPSTRFTGTRARPPMYWASIVLPSSQSSPNTRSLEGERTPGPTLIDGI